MSQRVLVDIHVLLDVLAQRQPHYAASAGVWAAAETHVIQGLVSANSITTLYYLLRRASDHANGLRGIRFVRDIFQVLPLDAALIEEALGSPQLDFEDAVQYHSALRHGAAIIVTRDARHYRNSTIPVLTPEAFLARPSGP